jgi:hypothetical protein
MHIEEKSIEDWCRKLGLVNYEIIDGVLNANGSVFISSNIYDKIPIQFGVVIGNFNCGHNFLVSLNGSPVKVSGNFYCNSNNLASLVGGPKEVGESFRCENNQLISLKGAPKEISHNFYCWSNSLKSLKYGPIKIGGYFDCEYNPVWDEYIKYDNYQQYMRSVKLKELIL